MNFIVSIHLVKALGYLFKGFSNFWSQSHTPLNLLDFNRIFNEFKKTVEFDLMKNKVELLPK